MNNLIEDEEKEIKSPELGDIVHYIPIETSYNGALYRETPIAAIVTGCKLQQGYPYLSTRLTLFPVNEKPLYGINASHKSQAEKNESYWEWANK